MTTQILDLSNIERKLFWILVSFISLALGLYLYSALSLTVSGIDRDHFARSAHDLATKAGDLEADYLAQSNAVTLAHAEELGFHEVNAKFAGVTPVKLSFAR